MTNILNKSLTYNEVSILEEWDKALKLLSTKKYSKAKLALMKLLEKEYNTDQIWYYLGIISEIYHDFQEALQNLNNAISINIHNPAYHYRKGQIIYKLYGIYQLSSDIAQESLKCYLDAIAQDHNFTKAYSAAAKMYYQLSNYDQAKEFFLKAIMLDPQDKHSIYMLSVINQYTPENIPEDYLVNIFNNVANYFDEHLVKNMSYQVPEYAAKICKKISVYNQKILDIGCGTGLVVEALIKEGIKTHFTGVDFSANMLRMAQRKKIYNKLILNNALDFLKLNSTKYNIILSIDTLIYIGNLLPLFKEISRSLTNGGYFIFSIEDGNDCLSYIMRQTMRYAHSVEYINQICLKTNLRMKICDDIFLRKEGDGLLCGYLICVIKY